MENTEIAQSPANENQTHSTYWSSPVMVVYLENGQQVSWMCNTIITTKNAFVNVRALLEIQALAHEHFLKSFPSKTEADITNTVVMGINNIGWMTPEEYLDPSTKKMLDDQLAAARSAA